MKEFVLIFDASDQGLLDISSLHPEPVEAFTFTPVQDEKMQVSTINKDRYELWIKTLKSAGKNFEAINA